MELSGIEFSFAGTWLLSIYRPEEVKGMAFHDVARNTRHSIRFSCRPSLQFRGASPGTHPRAAYRSGRAQAFRESEVTHNSSVGPCKTNLRLALYRCTIPVQVGRLEHLVEEKSHTDQFEWRETRPT